MLLESELKAITSQAGLMNQTFNLHYESGNPGALKAAVDALCRDVEEAVRGGCEVHCLYEHPNMHTRSLFCRLHVMSIALSTSNSELGVQGQGQKLGLQGSNGSCVQTQG